MDVDPIQEGAGNLRLILADLGRRTSAGLLRIPIVPTGAGIHRRQKHELSGIGCRRGRPANGDDAIFQGLAQGFQGIFLEFREFVQN